MFGIFVQDICLHVRCNVRRAVQCSFDVRAVTSTAGISHLLLSHGAIAAVTVAAVSIAAFWSQNCVYVTCCSRTNAQLRSTHV